MSGQRLSLTGWVAVVGGMLVGIVLLSLGHSNIDVVTNNRTPDFDDLSIRREPVISGSREDLGAFALKMAKEFNLPMEQAGEAPGKLEERALDQLSSAAPVGQFGPGHNYPKSFALTTESLESLLGLSVTSVVEGARGVAHDNIESSSGGSSSALALSHAAVFRLLESISSLHRVASYFIQHSQMRGVKDQNTVWTAIYPTLQCGSLVRLCHDADGCRFVCNGKALLSLAKNEKLLTIGVGSNNEWPHELSLIRSFGANVIEKLWVYDCTVEQPTPPAEVHSHPGYQFHKECLTVSGASPPKQGQKTTTLRILTDSLENRTIDLLKMDIEEFEFSIINDWLQTVLRARLHEIVSKEAGDQKRDGGTATMGKSAAPSGGMPKVKQLQMEMHLPAGESSAAIAFFAVLELSALGFHLVRQERNPWYAHCMEMLFVHTAYYIESEVHLALHSAPFLKL